MGFESVNRYFDYFQSLWRSHGSLPTLEFQTLVATQLQRIREQLVECNYEPMAIEAEMRLAVAAAQRTCFGDQKVGSFQEAEGADLNVEQAFPEAADVTRLRAKERGQWDTFVHSRFDRLSSEDSSGSAMVDSLYRLSFADAWVALKRHLVQIVAVTLLIGLASFFVAALLEDQYASNALILLEPQSDPALGPTSLSPTAADSEVEILKSDLVALKVAEKLALNLDSEFAPPESAAPNRLQTAFALIREFLGRVESRATVTLPDNRPNGPIIKVEALTQATRILQRHVTIRRRGMTDIIAVEATSRDPFKAAEIADAYVEVYLRHQLQARLRKFDLSEKAVTEQVRKHNDEFASADAQARVRARELYRDSLDQLKVLSQKRLLVLPNARIASPALVSDTPSSPRRGLIALGGSLMGLVVGLGIACLRQMRRRASLRRTMHV